MNRHEIIEAVKSYIRNENANYALLINGHWGCGKTFLYENYLSEEIAAIEAGKNERKTNIYVSLYGVSTVDALSKQLLTDYLIYAKAGGTELVKKGAKPIAGMLGIVSKAVSFSVGSFSGDLENIINGIIGVLELKDIIVCFDDLERCTIPINDFFGYVNNLVEHCNCKVIIMADEKNIGKIFANTNVEQKYKTILTGDRKVIHNQPDKTNRSESLITIKELKELNEDLYSEDYIYRDIKEKVIGKTLTYYPDIRDSLEDLISGTDKHKGYVDEGEYKNFLLEKIDFISSTFNEIDNRNLRIIIGWIDMFKIIYQKTCCNLIDSEYYKEIISEFMRYSIWTMVSYKKNMRLSRSVNYGKSEYVYLEGREYTHIFSFSFIDRFIRSDYLDEKDLVKAARTIEKRCEREQLYYSAVKIESTGIGYSKLLEWRYLEDEMVEANIKEMINELEAGKYAYRDYSNILSLLILFKKIGLYSGELSYIQDVMLHLIDNDIYVQKEKDYPLSFSNEEDKKQYIELYNPIAERRTERNNCLEKCEIEEENIYKSADLFYDHCKRRTEYYCVRKSFMEYIDEKKLIELIMSTSLEGVYTISDAFEAIYYMGNANEFYINDVAALQKLGYRIDNLTKEKTLGITRKYAIGSLIATIKNILLKLDASLDCESQ